MCISTKYWILYALCHTYVWPNYKLNRSYIKISSNFHVLANHVIAALYTNMSSVTLCGGQKTCFPTMLQTLFLAHEIISLKLSKTQNFRKMRQFLNRAVFEGLIPLLKLLSLLYQYYFLQLNLLFESFNMFLLCKSIYLALKMKILLVPVSWLLWTRSGLSGYLK